jgi:hypothetical protein
MKRALALVAVAVGMVAGNANAGIVAELMAEHAAKAALEHAGAAGTKVAAQSPGAASAPAAAATQLPGAAGVESVVGMAKASHSGAQTVVAGHLKAGEACTQLVRVGVIKPTATAQYLCILGGAKAANAKLVATRAGASTDPKAQVAAAK